MIEALSRLGDTAALREVAARSIDPDRRMEVKTSSAPELSRQKEINPEIVKKETGWSDEIVKNIRNEGEYEVYKNAGLKEGSVNGKPCLQRDIDPEFKDDFGRTNMERMQKGLAPYDAESGEKLELHHMGQKADAPFAELRENTDHGDGNHHILHDHAPGSWRSEPGRAAEYDVQRQAYWKTRAQQLSA